MARCEQCGNDYDKSFEVKMGGRTMIFDKFRMCDPYAGAGLPALRLPRHRAWRRARGFDLLLSALRAA